MSFVPKVDQHLFAIFSSLTLIAPKILYLCPKGKVSTDPWDNAMVWMSSNPKNIARKRVQERVKIS